MRDTFQCQKRSDLFSTVHNLNWHAAVVLATHSSNKPVLDSREKTSGKIRSSIASIHATVQPLLNIEQTARILGRSHWTLRRDIKVGKLRCIRIGRRIMIEPSEIRRIVEEGRG